MQSSTCDKDTHRRFLNVQITRKICDILKKKISLFNGQRLANERLYKVEASWNVMAHSQKPDIVFRRNGRVHLNRPAGASVQSTAGSRGVRISGSNAGYNVFRGSVKGTGYPLYSPVSPSLPLPCVTACHHISTGLYQNLTYTARVSGLPWPAVIFVYPTYYHEHQRPRPERT